MFVSVAMLAHLDQCSAQLKTLKRASRSLAKTGLFLGLNGGSENEVEKSVKKITPKGPQMDPQSC